MSRMYPIVAQTAIYVHSLRFSRASYHCAHFIHRQTENLRNSQLDQKAGGLGSTLARVHDCFLCPGAGPLPSGPRMLCLVIQDPTIQQPRGPIWPTAEKALETQAAKSKMLGPGKHVKIARQKNSQGPQGQHFSNNN